MTFDEFEKRLGETAILDARLTTCVQEIRGGRVRRIEPGPGRMTVREAVATFTIRAATAKEAGIAVNGLDEAIERLRVTGDSDVLLFHYEGGTRGFTIFAKVDGRPIACVAIPHREAERT